MKIGILITGHLPEQLADDFGNYGDMFESLLQDEGFTFAKYTVLENHFPNLDDCDGYIITGSKYGVYENLEWIPKLEKLLEIALKQTHQSQGSALAIKLWLKRWVVW